MKCPVEDCEVNISPLNGVEIVGEHSLAMSILVHIIQDHKLIDKNSSRIRN